MVQIDPENGMEICERCEGRQPEGLDKYEFPCTPGPDCLLWSRYYDVERDVRYAWQWGIPPESLEVPSGFSKYAIEDSRDLRHVYTPSKSPLAQDRLRRQRLARDLTGKRRDDFPRTSKPIPRVLLAKMFGQGGSQR